MKITTTNTAYQPAFNARFSEKTLRLLSDGIEKTEEGNKLLRSIVNRVDKIGRKNTIIDAGIYSCDTGKRVFSVSGNTGKVTQLPKLFIKCTNSLFPNEETCVLSEDVHHEINFINWITDLLFNKTTVPLDNMIKSAEVSLFNGFISSHKNKEPDKLVLEYLKKTPEILENFTDKQVDEMVGYAAYLDRTTLEKSADCISKDIEEETKKIKSLEENRAKTVSLMDTLPDLKEQVLGTIKGANDVEKERIRILDAYA